MEAGNKRLEDVVEDEKEEEKGKGEVEGRKGAEGEVEEERGVVSAKDEKEREGLNSHILNTIQYNGPRTTFASFIR